jgi:Predicted 3''-5'' exonuclease related to the exonuclease domain of PolB.
MITYIDIETVTKFQDFESADERTQDLFIKKLRAEIQEDGGNRDPYEIGKELYPDKAALFAEFNKVVCVSFGAVVSDTETKEPDKIVLKSVTGDNEEALLNEVAFSLHKAHTLCAHYGKGFDYPVLSRKFVMYGIQLPMVLDNAGKKPWEISLIDTAELWKFGDLRHSASLDLIAHCFGLPSPKSDISGADVSRVYWVDKDLKRIAEYCERDVKTLINVHRKISGLSVILD